MGAHPRRPMRAAFTQALAAAPPGLSLAEIEASAAPECIACAAAWHDMVRGFYRRRAKRPAMTEPMQADLFAKETP